MACDFKACSFYIFLAVLAAIGVFLLLYIVLYAYIAYITRNYHSNDLVEWKEKELEAVEKRFASMPL
jgi:hypothetical protein